MKNFTWKSGSTAWKEFQYGVFSGPCFPVFSPNTGKYGPEKTPYLDTLGTMSQQFTATRDRSIAKNYLRLTYNKN